MVDGCCELKSNALKIRHRCAEHWLSFVNIRAAKETETAVLEKLIRASVWDLQAHCYTESQRRWALGTVFGVDTQLINDQTYYVVEVGGQVAACGGWSYRSTLFGSMQERSQRSLS